MPRSTTLSAVAYGAAWPRQRSAVGIRGQIALLLLGHVLLWTWVGWSSRSNFDGAGDMVEAYAWGQNLQWGYFKHPPLSAWVARLWFSVVPESLAGYSLLAALNGAIGLAGLALLAREFLPRRWLLLCVAMASLTPSITTLALRFNANAILLSTWPLAAALFVRLMHRNRPIDAVGCGVVCALAMLGKYYSGVLLLSLLASACLLPQWRCRWRTVGPWLACAVFAVCMAPHLAWLLAQTDGPLQYAAAATAPESAGASVQRALHFALSQWAYLLPGLAVLAYALSGGRRAALWQAVTAMLRPRWEATWLIGMLPVVATMAATVATGARTAAVWGLPIAAGLTLLAVCRARDAGAVPDPRRLWRAMVVVWIAIAVASPLWLLGQARGGSAAIAEPRAELAQALDAAWRNEFMVPLPWVSGSPALAASTSFYTGGQARYWSFSRPVVETPWVDVEAVRQFGGIVVCALDDAACQSLADSLSAERRNISVAKRVAGFEFAPVHYHYYVLAPQDDAIAI